MRLSLVLAVAGAVLLAGCATPYEKGVARMAARIDQRLSNAVGGTVGDFIDQTGARPRDAYDRGGARVFVFDGGPCRVRLTTERIAASDAPDAWRVVDVDHTGRCEQIVAN